MKHLITGTAERGRMIRKDTVNIGDARLKYRFFSVRSAGQRIYKICVIGMGEKSTCRFGSNKRKACGIYGKIVRNAVTPCTLADVAEDFAAERG